MMFFKWTNKVSENAPSHTSLNTVLLGPVCSQTQRGGEKTGWLINSHGFPLLPGEKYEEGIVPA